MLAGRLLAEPALGRRCLACEGGQNGAHVWIDGSCVSLLLYLVLQALPPGLHWLLSIGSSP